MKQGLSRAYITTKSDAYLSAVTLPGVPDQSLTYLFARSAASTADVALTNSDTFDTPPVRKHSTIPRFLSGQYPKSSPVTTSLTLGWGMFTRLGWERKVSGYQLNEINDKAYVDNSSRLIATLWYKTDVCVKWVSMLSLSGTIKMLGCKVILIRLLLHHHHLP